MADDDQIRRVGAELCRVAIGKDPDERMIGRTVHAISGAMEPSDRRLRVVGAARTQAERAELYKIAGHVARRLLLQLLVDAGHGVTPRIRRRVNLALAARPANQRIIFAVLRSAAGAATGNDEADIQTIMEKVMAEDTKQTRPGDQESRRLEQIIEKVRGMLLEEMKATIAGTVEKAVSEAVDNLGQHIAKLRSEVADLGKKVSSGKRGTGAGRGSLYSIVSKPVATGKAPAPASTGAAKKKPAPRRKAVAEARKP